MSPSLLYERAIYQALISPLWCRWWTRPRTHRSDPSLFTWSKTTCSHAANTPKVRMEQLTNDPCLVCAYLMVIQYCTSMRTRQIGQGLYNWSIHGILLRAHMLIAVYGNIQERAYISYLNGKETWSVGLSDVCSETDYKVYVNLFWPSIRCFF